MKKKLIGMILLSTLFISACGNTEQGATEQGSQTAISSEIISASEEKSAANAVTETTSEKESTSETSIDTDTISADIDLDDYVGYYVDGDYNEVTIEKNGDDYNMTVSIVGLTFLDEGTVSADSGKVIFDTVDASGNPMKISFYESENGSYSLCVDESTWELLESGTEFTNLTKTSSEETSSAQASTFENGHYTTDLIPEPMEYSFGYVKSISFEADCIVIDASFSYSPDGDYENITELKKDTYVFMINDETKFLSGGGEDEPTYMEMSEFEEYINDLMESGLGLSITVEDGYVSEIGIWS